MKFINNQKGFVNVIVIVLVIVGLVGLIGLAVVKNTKTPAFVALVPTATPAIQTTSIANASSTLDTSGLPRDEVLRGWKTYRNEKYGFEIALPADYKPDFLKENSLWFSKLDSNGVLAKTFSLRIISNQESSLVLWIEKNIFGRSSLTKELKPISISGMSGFLNLDDLYGMEVYVWLGDSTNKNIFEFFLSASSSYDWPVRESELLAIINTLKFFEPKPY